MYNINHIASKMESVQDSSLIFSSSMLLHLNVIERIDMNVVTLGNHI